jgi:hypothetical protein
MSNFNAKLLENFDVEQAINPQNISGTATTSLYFGMQFWQHVVFIYSQGAWAAGTAAVTFQQAKTSAGGSAKALVPLFPTTLTTPTLMEYWQMSADQTQAASAWVRTTVAPASFVLPNQANTITIVEITAQMLDFNNGFTYVQTLVASPGANIDLLSVVAVLTQGRLSRSIPTPDPKP